MPLTKVTKSLITSVDVSQINTSAGDAGKVLTSNGSTLGWTASASITPSSTTTAKAWVNYNGNTSTISSSYNVSSVTKNSAGNYTINFTTAMADANYATVACGRSGSIGVGCIAIDPSVLPTTTSVRVVHGQFAGSGSTGYPSDTAYANVAIFGN